MKVTMKEIAERAGVHPSTVDKVVHHRVGVSDEVRARVQAIINELGYTPNPSGRVLQRQGKVYRISAILVEVDALPYLKKGIERGVKEQTGFDIEITYAVTGFQEAKRQSELRKRRTASFSVRSTRTVYVERLTERLTQVFPLSLRIRISTVRAVPAVSASTAQEPAVLPVG